MNDPKKSAEALKKIQEIKNKINSHTMRISQFEHEKSVKIKNCDMQIANEQNQIKQYSKQIDELKKQI